MNHSGIPRRWHPPRSCAKRVDTDGVTWEARGQPGDVLWLALSPARLEHLLRQRAHTRGHLAGHAVIAQDIAQVAQPAGLALDDEMPQCNARLRNQLGAQLAACS